VGRKFLLEGLGGDAQALHDLGCDAETSVVSPGSEAAL
jgi:hypothetical protein